MGVVLELRLTPEAEDGLARLAARTGASREAVVSEAIERFVADELATIEGIESALEEMRQGRVVAQEDVIQAVEARLTRADTQGP